MMLVTWKVVASGRYRREKGRAGQGAASRQKIDLDESHRRWVCYTLVYCLYTTVHYLINHISKRLVALEQTGTCITINFKCFPYTDVQVRISTRPKHPTPTTTATATTISFLPYYQVLSATVVL